MINSTPEEMKKLFRLKIKEKWDKDLKNNKMSKLKMEESRHNMKDTTF